MVHKRASFENWTARLKAGKQKRTASFLAILEQARKGFYGTPRRSRMRPAEGKADLKKSFEAGGLAGKGFARANNACPSPFDAWLAKCRSGGVGACGGRPEGSRAGGSAPWPKRKVGPEKRGSVREPSPRHTAIEAAGGRREAAGEGTERLVRLCTRTRAASIPREVTTTS